MEAIDNCWRENGDGAGIISVNNGRFVVNKTTKLKQLKRLIKQHEQNDSYLSIHFRWASVGAVNQENIHPFQVNDDVFMAHNGTFVGIKPPEGESDTKYMARWLSALPRGWHNSKTMLTLIEHYFGSKNKVVFYKRGSFTITNQDAWVNDDDLLWSNKDYLIAPAVENKESKALTTLVKCEFCYRLFPENELVQQVNYNSYSSFFLCSHCRAYSY
jgi:hypothetical protein